MALAMPSLIGPPPLPSAFRQYKPSFFPGELMMRWAYWVTPVTWRARVAYSFCASTNPRQIWMVFSSLAPTRRYRTSRRPALESKRHFPLLFTIGTGIGQLSEPTVTMARAAFLGSDATEVF